MTEADVELIRTGFDTFAEDGLEAILRLMDPDIELLTPANPDIQRGIGHDGVRRTLNGLLEMFEYWNVEALDYDDLGEHVVVSVCQYARGRGSGVTVESKSAWLFTMRDGKAVRLSLHSNKDEAIAALP